MFRLSPRRWVAVGLLIVSLALLLRSIGPAQLHAGWGDVATAALLGVGLGIEIMAVVKMRRERARPSP